MLVVKDIHKILSQLSGQEVIQFTIDGSEILIRSVDDATKLSLSTSVYNGGNYIPSSVRRSLSLKSPVGYSPIKTFLTVDEKNYSVKLNYINSSEKHTSYEEFKALLEEFGSVAEKWRQYLDENDKNDLLYIRINR